MKRENLYTETGEPKRIRCYMQKRRKTLDHITVVYTYISKTGNPVGTVLYRGMSEDPYHPQGFGIMGEGCRSSFNPGGSRVSFSELPINCRELVYSDYSAIWDV